jgi:hypothetical protein
LKRLKPLVRVAKLIASACSLPVLEGLLLVDSDAQQQLLPPEGASGLDNIFLGAPGPQPQMQTVTMHYGSICSLTSEEMGIEVTATGPHNGFLSRLVGHCDDASSTDDGGPRQQAGEGQEEEQQAVGVPLPGLRELQLHCLDWLTGERLACLLGQRHGRWAAVESGGEASRGAPEGSSRSRHGGSDGSVSRVRSLVIANCPLVSTDSVSRLTVLNPLMDVTVTRSSGAVPGS